ncbi:hypothetical protein ACJ73_05959 [Blastomyces percursus]|uniref:Uncharacterized protein n=1 Tax=Blastomyces percursus TaxID=1658174 RepID=A0A1J9R2H9_9EURO|nr:hypothetical protein ACJ73_05959 [Blastomyces percursus]
MSRVFKRLYTVVGKVTFDNVKEQNVNGSAWVSSLDSAASDAEKTDPRIKHLKIQGAKAHQSHTDPNDPKPVISVQYLNDLMQRVRSEHVHEDGTTKSKTE